MLTSTLTAGAVNEFECDWQNYELIIVSLGTYWNIEENQCVPTTAYFSRTNSSTRMILKYSTDTNNQCHVYQLGEGKIGINPSDRCAASSNMYLRVYGVIGK